MVIYLYILEYIEAVILVRDPLELCHHSLGFVVAHSLLFDLSSDNICLFVECFQFSYVSNQAFLEFNLKLYIVHGLLAFGSVKVGRGGLLNEESLMFIEVRVYIATIHLYQLLKYAFHII